MKTVSFPCPHVSTNCPLTFCSGEARDNGKGKYFCGVCGSSYGSYESAQGHRIEAYQTASKTCMDHSQEYSQEAVKLEHRLKANQNK